MENSFQHALQDFYHSICHFLVMRPPFNSPAIDLTGFCRLGIRKRSKISSFPREASRLGVGGVLLFKREHREHTLRVNRGI